MDNRKSEVGEGQCSIFNEAEKEADPKADEPTIEVATHQCKKRGKNREDLSLLPTETIHYRLDEKELSCQTCGDDLHEMSTETRREAGDLRLPDHQGLKTPDSFFKWF